MFQDHPRTLSDTQIGITGIGLVSPYGETVGQYVGGLKKMQKVERQVSLFTAQSLQKRSGVEIDLSGFNLLNEARLVEMGVRALRSALRDWGRNPADFKRIGLVIGSGLGMADLLANWPTNQDPESYLGTLGKKLAERLGLDCEVIYIGNACAAGSQAVSYGKDLLENDCFDLVIAGGIDMLSQVAYAGFLRLNAIDPDGCHPFDQARKGIMVSEGAAFFVLEKNGFPAEKLKKYCILAGTGVTNDAYNVVQLKPDGREIRRAMEEALKDAGLSTSDIDLVVAHGTGTVQNDKTEAGVIADFFQSHLAKMVVTAPKGAIGHTGGAGGPFGLVVAIDAILTGEIPPVFNLENIDPDCRIPLVTHEVQRGRIKAAMVNAFAFGGTNVIIVCKKWDLE